MLPVTPSSKSFMYTKNVFDVELYQKAWMISRNGNSNVISGKGTKVSNVINIVIQLCSSKVYDSDTFLIYCVNYSYVLN